MQPTSIPALGSYVNPLLEMVTLDQKERQNYEKLFASKVVAYEDLQVGESIGEGLAGWLESWTIHLA